LQKKTRPDILHTYSDERQKVAKTLIDFDKEFARLFSAPIKASETNKSTQVDASLLQDYFQKHGRFTAGTNIQYQASLITWSKEHQELASGFEIGTRFHSAPVTRFADAKPMHLGHTVKADGRWRLFAFNNQEDPRSHTSVIAKLSKFLCEHEASPARRDTRKNDDPDAVIDVRIILQQAHRELHLLDLPTSFFPAKGRYALIDYEKVFCPAADPAQDIFDLRQVDRTNGCIVIVRPDQHVSAIFPLAAQKEISSFFSKFML
jgi:phenol 2-monooxygenase